MSWLQRILSKEDLAQYEGEASRWDCCALHEVDLQVPGIVVHHPLFKNPEDPTLYQLGVQFSHAVRANHHRRAFRIYRAIQARVAALAGVK